MIDTAFTWGGDKPPNSLARQRPLRDAPAWLHHAAPRRAGICARHRCRVLAAGGDRPSQGLGVTAVEFLPIHAFVQDRHLIARGLSNYWGYNTIGFFAPEQRYLATGDLAEWKAMVCCLHDAGIEVMIDVVYNHTAEGNHLGPTLSSRASTTPPTTS